MASRTGKRTCTGIERASAWKQKPTLPIPRSNPASTGARSDVRLRRGQPVSHALEAAIALAPTSRLGQRLRKRYGNMREHRFTFLDHPDVAAINASERELRPTAACRKVTGRFRSTWGADLYAAVRSVIGTAARRGIGAYQAIRTTLQGQSVLAPG